MAIVNWSSIMNKAKTCMKSPEKKKEIQKQVDGFIISGLGFKTIGSNGNRINNVKVAAERFVEILKECINECRGYDFANGNLGDTAIDALNEIEIGSIEESGGKNCYTIPISFTTDRHRDSLVPSKYGGIDDIVALLNNGYPRDGHTMGTVFGIWHGADTASLTDRQGAYFIESAVHKFMSSEAKKYGVKEIKVDIMDYKQYY